MRLIFLLLIFTSISFAADGNFEAAKITFVDLIPKEIFADFSTDLQDFLKGLTDVDLAYLFGLTWSQQEFKGKNFEEVLQTLENGAKSDAEKATIFKIGKLMDAYKKRYDRMTPKAQEYVDEVYESSKSGLTLDDERRERWVRECRRKFRKLSHEDRESLKPNFPLVYKLFRDNRFTSKLETQIRKLMSGAAPFTTN
ncbi:unnamed protein product, partial [Mesorhabditis spiculigera]